jgi:hypothetical protein
MTTQEKPEPDQKAKENAAKIMEAYEDRPTLVLPGSGKTMTGTAVNDWLDEDGNSKFANDGDAPAAKPNAHKDETPDGQPDEDKGESHEDKVASDKAYNEEVLKAAKDRAAASK